MDLNFENTNDRNTNMKNSLTKRKTLAVMTAEAYAQNKRLAAPLVGFPGCDLLNMSIKVAQQNYGMHYNCIEALVNRLKPDAAFMMMDLSVEANALGLPVRFPTHESSTVEHHPINTVDDLDYLRQINILQDARIQSYIKTIEMMKLGLPDNVLVGAYVIGPVTLAGLLEGAQQVAFDSILEPEKLDEFCRFSTSIIMEYARSLVNAGADVLCILEPTGVILGPEQFDRFSGHYVNHILQSYKYAGVDTIYHICGNTMHLINGMVKSGVGAISIDSPETGFDIVKALEQVPQKVVVIGNVNPTKVMKDGTPEEVAKETKDLLEKTAKYPNFLLSTGCDLPPGTPLKNMQVFMETARKFKI
ncbi:MAG TPA: uroporphyrinogen decarboxylase (URO-D) [Phycisphaerales bacterium]|nr:uroporphyrinogen decarboxylase (URO-D) [Phycisphaerales bacterium]